MLNNYPHLKIEREEFTYPRRRRKPGSGAFLPPERGDLLQYGLQLHKEFSDTFSKIKQRDVSATGRYIFKFKYNGLLNIPNLEKEGLECIEQTKDYLMIIFKDEKFLAVFSENLKKLGSGDITKSLTVLMQMIDSIGGWGAEERKSWAIKQYGFPKEDTYKLDIELWPIYFTSHTERIALMQNFESFLIAHSIRKLDRVNKDSLIMYRIEINDAQKNMLLEHLDIRMIDIIPNTGISYQSLNRDIHELPSPIQHPPTDAPKICILDSGVTTNHPLLASAIADSQNFTDDLTDFDETEKGHGTAVAGIALYGDLELRNRINDWKPDFWILSGKILNKDNSFPEKTIESTLDEAIRYFSNTFNCRLFNLSIGNTNAPYDNQHIKGMAYTLDQLSRELNILIIVSAGNFTGSDNPLIPQNSWREEYPEYLLMKESTIIDPAPAINVITVGSLAKHEETNQAARYPNEINQLAFASFNQPSPFTRHGPSLLGVIKPDFVAYGGNYAVNIRQPQEHNPISINAGLGVLSLNKNFVDKTLLTEISGTSFSTPYITHLAARIMKEYPDYSNNLVRALLANHALVPQETKNTFSNNLQNIYESTCRNTGLGANRKIINDVAGYGLINENNLFRSTEDVVVLLQDDFIKNNTNNFYELPFPEEFMRSKRALREIHVSLAYTPPVRTTRIDYRASKISFTLVRDPRSLSEVKRHFDQNLKYDTKNIGEYAGNRSCITKETRDKATLQSSSWTVKQGSPEHNFYLVVTRQDTDWGNALCNEEEPYAIVVTVTDRENENAQLYTKIKANIELKQQIRIRI